MPTAHFYRNVILPLGFAIVVLAALSAHARQQDQQKSNMHRHERQHAAEPRVR